MKSSNEVTDMNAATATAIAALVGAAVLSPAPCSAERADQVTLHSQMLVSTSWLEEHLDDKNLVVLYVARSRSEYDAGHIPGAHFLPLDELVEQHKDSLNDLRPIATLQSVFESLGIGDDTRVVLCGEGGGLLAARAYFTLDYLGHGDQVALLDGGMEKWTAEDRPTNHQPVHSRQAHFTPRIQSDVLITTARMREIAHQNVDGGSNDVVVLDARPPREFDGTVISEAVPKAGHLPGAQALYWKTLLEPGAVPALLDATQLREVFMRAGADPSKLIVTYCRTGMQSSFTYFVAKYLGYKAAMYDGSVYEWVNRWGYDLVVSTMASGDLGPK
jgi:thiosulfate/3-mercaptopyruvate sulfurtransferase